MLNGSYDWRSWPRPSWSRPLLLSRLSNSPGASPAPRGRSLRATGWRAAGLARPRRWAMHFIGMLAFSLPIPVAYDIRFTVLSLAIAVAAAWSALRIVRPAPLAPYALTVAAIVLGLGIAGMHYAGMAALRMQPAIAYEADLVVASIAVAILLSGAALAGWRTAPATPPRRASRAGWPPR